MCGVAGLSLAARERVSESSLWAAASALTHRGPDDSGVFLTSSGGVGLAHARLSIIDLSPLGHQPMVSDDGRVVLAFNGEIYNYRALRESLASDGHEFRGESDTEVLLHLYLQFRERGGALSDYLQRLNGVFAFAIWDADREALLLVRDGLGVKPLYYYEGSDQLAFASEIKALLPLVPSLGALDPEAIHRYLSFLWCPGEGTPARRVRKLQPGELLWVQEGKIAERGVWYRLPAFADRQGREPSGPALSFATEAIAGTAAQVRQAVHRQMVDWIPARSLPLHANTIPLFAVLPSVPPGAAKRGLPMICPMRNAWRSIWTFRWIS